MHIWQVIEITGGAQKGMCYCRWNNYQLGLKRVCVYCRWNNYQMGLKIAKCCCTLNNRSRVCCATEASKEMICVQRFFDELGKK